MTGLDRAGRTDTVMGLLGAINSVGRDPRRGGYSRPVFDPSERELREWFVAEATKRGLDVTTDRNGIIWAWWAPASGSLDDAVVTGSHLDSVPGGGEFDGPLGVASALVAVDMLRARGVEPRRALGVVVFPEEEGSRFGVACLGSRLLSGAIDPARALSLKDRDGNTFAEVAAASGFDPDGFGHDPASVARIGRFVELHVEQGRGLVDLDRPVAIGSSILGHGRWRLSVSGEGNHAGTTLMSDRRDPMVAASQIIVDVRAQARGQRDARATVGRIEAVPGGSNVVASRVDLWLDVRHPDDAVTLGLVESIRARAMALAASEGCTVTVVEESFSATADFDGALRDWLGEVLPDAPVLATGAGHDAGVLAASVPTAMLFVRNPSGISHSPEEYVEGWDAEAGAEDLATILERLLMQT